MISALDIFRIGIGPSSSHTVGPMRIAARFMTDLARAGLLARVARLSVSLQGSLAFTGVGHRTPEAVYLGILGFKPETTDPEAAEAAVKNLLATSAMRLQSGQTIAFNPAVDLIFDYETPPKLHPNGMTLLAVDAAGRVRPALREAWCKRASCQGACTCAAGHPISMRS